MILNVNANYPHARTFVLKLHRDCVPQDGLIAGRLEHIASGHSRYFASVSELIACLTSLDATAEEHGS